MKIGIVTIFDTENLGNRLQNYALQQVLLKYADQVITIKNKMRSEDESENRKRASGLAESILLNRLLGKHRKVRFLQFNRKYIRFSKNCYWFNEEIPALKPEDRCDLYCAGSDQIWNPLFDRRGMFNFLGFAESDCTFSYAASFGINEIPKSFQTDVRSGLQHMNRISVREEAGKNIVEELTGRTDAQVLIDPTMLLTSEEWDGLVSKPEAALPQNYLLMYFLGQISAERRTVIREKAKAMGCEIIELMDPESPFHKIGPCEFLYLIKHAKMVCTDSFHGSVFSFLWQRPLAIFDRAENTAAAGMESRIKTFAKTFHLESCLCEKDQIPDISETADYSAGYRSLNAEREKAHAFLKTVLENRP